MENYSHKPFENWIFDNTSLTLEQRTQLYQHLRECPRCRQLQQGWGEIERQISQAQMAQPAEGFCQRWRISLQGRKSIEIRHQTWKILIWLNVAALISLSVLALQVGTGTPFEFFLSMMKTIARFIADIFTLIEVAVALLNAFPSIITVPLSLISVCVFSYLIYIWVRTYLRFSNNGVFSK